MREFINARVRLTSKGRYAVRALFHLAYHPDEPAQMKAVAEHTRIPLRFLEQIFHELKHAGLLVAKRGPRGGYRLARSSSQISLGDVVRALEGSAFALTRSEERDRGRDPVATTFVELAHAVERCFDAVSFADVCRTAERMAVPRRPRGSLSRATKGAAASAPPDDEGPEYAI